MKLKIPPLGEVKKELAAIPGACVAIVSEFALTGQTAHIVTTIGVIAGLISVYFVGPNDPPVVAKTLAQATTAPATVSQGTLPGPE